MYGLISYHQLCETSIYGHQPQRDAPTYHGHFPKNYKKDQREPALRGNRGVAKASPPANGTGATSAGTPSAAGAVPRGATSRRAGARAAARVPPALRQLLREYKPAIDEDRPDIIANVGNNHGDHPVAIAFLTNRVNAVADGRLRSSDEIRALALTLPNCLPHFPLIALALIEKLTRMNPEPDVLFRLGLGIREADNRGALAHLEPEFRQAVRALQASLDYYEAQQHERIRYACAATQTLLHDLNHRASKPEPRSVVVCVTAAIGIFALTALVIALLV